MRLALFDKLHSVNYAIIGIKFSICWAFLRESVFRFSCACEHISELQTSSPAKNSLISHYMRSLSIKNKMHHTKCFRANELPYRSAPLEKCQALNSPFCLCRWSDSSQPGWICHRIERSQCTTIHKRTETVAITLILHKQVVMLS